MSKMCELIAKYQITRGGPVILMQPENEWTDSADPYMPYPLGDYMQYVMDQATAAGIEVPFISNDARPEGHNRPGTGVGQVDVYGYDTYPMGFDCSQPSVWPNTLGYDLWETHQKWSPNQPHAIPEFQGGVLDLWGGAGYDKCAAKANHEFARVFIKNNFAQVRAPSFCREDEPNLVLKQGVKLLNLYMTYGGTDWANIGDPALYTSYDYGSSIEEDRSVTREKYSELKLQATFLTASPDYLTAIPQGPQTGVYSSETKITVTPVVGNDTGAFFVVRQTAYTSTASVNYTLLLPTVEGNITVPHGGNHLRLIGRDSKMMVTSYGTLSPKLLYSTADVFTYGIFGNQKVLAVYAGSGEYNELSIEGDIKQVKRITGSGNYTSQKLDGSSKYLVIGWETPEDKIVLQVGDVTVLLLSKASSNPVRRCSTNVHQIDIQPTNTGSLTLLEPIPASSCPGHTL